MRIDLADLADPRVLDLLRLHVARAQAETARGSAHALDLDRLKSPDVTVWALWEGERLGAVGALKRLPSEHGPGHGEVKSMHTAEALRGRGVGSAMLRHILAEARHQGLTRLSLETGSWDYFQPARALYRRHGFVEGPPFANYRPDPNSVFMSKELQEG